MKRVLLFTVLAVIVALPVLAKGAKTTSTKTTSAKMSSHDWDMNATIIEACSCPMFCSCYFGSGHPAGHHDMETHSEQHFCRFNNAIKVNKGHYKDVKLDGALFWVAGDLGSEFAKGGEWAAVTFDKSVSAPQREAIGKIVAKLYPLSFKTMTLEEGDITWMAGDNESRAAINNGEVAEVVLTKGGFGQMGKTPVIKDLQYWGSNSNAGFVLMPNSVEAYRTGAAPFEYKGTNGFMITFDIYGNEEASGGTKGGGN